MNKYVLTAIINFIAPSEGFAEENGVPAKTNITGHEHPTILPNYCVDFQIDASKAKSLQVVLGSTYIMLIAIIPFIKRNYSVHSNSENLSMFKEMKCKAFYSFWWPFLDDLQTIFSKFPTTIV